MLPPFCPNYQYLLWHRQRAWSASNDVQKASIVEIRGLDG